MKLKEIIKKMIQSDRLIIEDREGNILYQGFVANYDQDIGREVKKICVKTDIFVREKSGVLNHKKRIVKEIQEEETADYKFNNLEMRIYLRAIVGENDD